MTDIVKSNFDYTDVNPEVRLSAERIKIRMKRTAEDIVEIGKELIAVKEMLPHGQFLPWIGAEFGMGERTARKFLQAGRKFGKTALNADFTPSVIYELSLDSTSDEVIEKATEKAESGEKVTTENIREWKRQVEEKDKQNKTLKEQIEDLSDRLINSGEELKKAKDLATDQLGVATTSLLNQSKLREEIKELKNQPPERVEVEVAPKGFKSVEEAIAAKQEELKQEEAELRRVNKERIEQGKRIESLEAKRIREEKRLADVERHIKSMGDDAADAGLKKSQIQGCISTVRTFAGNMLQYDAIIHNRVAYPEMDSDIEDLKKVVKEAQSYLNKIVSPTVSRNITPIHPIIEHREAV